MDNDFGWCRNLMTGMESALAKEAFALDDDLALQLKMSCCILVDGQLSKMSTITITAQASQ